MHPFTSFIGRVLTFVLFMSNVLGTPFTSLEPRGKKHEHGCVKPKVFLIDMVCQVNDIAVFRAKQ